MAAEGSEENSYDVISTTFPKEICYIDAQINSLFEVRLDPRLISINLHCNNISVIENLERLQHLKHLDLSSNHISRMQGLGGLKSLRTLNLSCNELQAVEGLENLRYCLLLWDGGWVGIGESKIMWFNFKLVVADSSSRSRLCLWWEPDKFSGP